MIDEGIAVRGHGTYLFAIAPKASPPV